MINGTLFVQLFHFICAYYLFKKILLKPFLEMIEQEEYEKKRLNIEIVQLKNKTMQLYEQKQELWQLCLKKISAIRPSLAVHRIDQKEGYSAPENISPEQKQYYLDVVTKYLIEQLGHTDKQK